MSKPISVDMRGLSTVFRGANAPVVANQISGPAAVTTAGFPRNLMSIPSVMSAACFAVKTKVTF
jgi:hypothetical protein